MSENNVQRPTLIAVLGAIYLLVGIVLIAAGAYLCAADAADLLDAGLDPDVVDAAGVLGALVAVLGAIDVIVALGFHRGWAVMWYLGLISLVAGIVLNIYYVALGEYANIVAVVIGAVLIYYVFRPNVKMYFLGHE